MTNCERRTSGDIRQAFEQKYSFELGCLRRGLTPEPDLSAPDYQQWHESVAFIGELMDSDPGKFDILYRLSVPIDERLDEIKLRITRERQALSPGYRKKKARLKEDDLLGSVYDAMYDQLELDRVTPKRDGGFTDEGKWVDGDLGIDLTGLEDELEERKIEREKKQEVLEDEVQRLNGPLSPEEQYRIDHELG